MDKPSMKHFSQAFPRHPSHLPGMTLRDYFAAKAMQGLLACDIETGEIPAEAYAMADAMLKARDASQ